MIRCIYLSWCRFNCEAKNTIFHFSIFSSTLWCWSLPITLSFKRHVTIVAIWDFDEKTLSQSKNETVLLSCLDLAILAIYFTLFSSSQREFYGPDAQLSCIWKRMPLVKISGRLYNCKEMYNLNYLLGRGNLPTFEMNIKNVTSNHLPPLLIAHK